MTQPRAGPSLSTAVVRRPEVVSAAISAFAHRGYRGTSMSTIAARSGISEAYVFRLFRDKRSLFIAAIATCGERIGAALVAGADERSGADPDEVLASMAAAYAELIGDHDLLMIQVHALAACDDPHIRDALRELYRGLTELVLARSGARDAEVQHFFARGQLCHLVLALGLFDRRPESSGSATGDGWADVLTGDLRHPTPDEP